MTREKFIQFITSNRFQLIYKSENAEYLTFAQHKEKCEKYAAKYKCMIENNVVILKSTQYEEYLEYGHDYIKQFEASKKV